METNGHNKGAGDALRARLFQKQLDESEIVDVIPEEGFVYKFRKPSKFALLFGSGDLPQSVASEAITAWNEGNEIDVETLNALSEDTKIRLAKKAFDLRDKIISHSVSPKIVIGATSHPDELSTDDIPDIHLEYFLKWMAAGGDAGLMLATFPQGQEQRSMAGANRKERRTKAKRTRGVK